MEIKQIAQYDTKTRKNSNRFRVYSSEGIVATLKARDYKGPKLIAIKSEVSRKHKS